MRSSPTSTRDTVVRLRSGASVTEATDAGQLGGQDEQVGPLGQGRQDPREHQGEGEAVGRVGSLGQLEHAVLEGEQCAGFDLEREVQVERAPAGVLGVEVDLPRLAQRVGLHEVALVVHVELVVDGVILEIGDEARDIDDGQGVDFLVADGVLSGGARPSRQP